MDSLQTAMHQVFKWQDPIETGAEGWVVIHSLVNGLSAGGLFMHAGATLEEVSDLAKTMSYKNTLLDPILGGAKAGIRFDHQDPRALDVIRRFLMAHKFLLENCWFTGADLNTSNDFIFDVIEQDLGLPSAFYSLANMLKSRFGMIDQSCSLRKRLSSCVGEKFTLETCSTGYSVATAIELLTPKLKPRVLIQGFGTVGSSLCYFLNVHQSATLVGIADIDGFIYHPEGISIENLRAKNGCERGLSLLDEDKAKYHWTPRLNSETDEEFLCRFLASQPAEIFSPCATRYQITENVSKTLLHKTFSEVKASQRFIVSGANNAFQVESARTLLENSGMQVLPEWVSNSGNTILFMESMKEYPEKFDWNEHVFNSIHKQIKSFIGRDITNNHQSTNGLYENCSRLAVQRLCPPFLLERLKEHVQTKPEAIAFTFLDNQGHIKETITYAELDRRSRLLADTFYRKNLTQERVILLYPTGLDFIVSFLACLYAGVVAVPVSAFNQENFSRSFPLLRSIIKDAGVKMIATIDSLAEMVRWELSIHEPDVDIFCTDRISSQNKKNEISSHISFELSSTTLSHLQYTSGSTSTPKGVICNHLNLAYSLSETAKTWEYTADSVTVNWAPHTHVYGLTVGLLVPLYSGTHAVLMTPNDFLINPLNWLSIISKFKATHSGSPNFGYEFCVEHIDEADMEQEKLNLNSWRVATNGGEPVQQATLLGFFNKFKSYGFKLENFYPAYGMSECMGLIATPKKRAKPRIENMSISCGTPIKGISVKIVDPDSKLEVNPLCVGEIWLAGPICSQGYWNEKLTDNYIKTGDLGYMHQGELFVVGRLKELIILYGKNYYPTDIEMSVKKSHERFAKYSCVAFSSRIENQEELFVLLEIEESSSEQEYQAAVASVRLTLSLEQGIDAYAVILVPIQSIPKTGSGKIQRKEASQRYFNQELKILHKSIKTSVKNVV